MARSEQIIAAIDIGTSKIVAVAGKKNEEGKIEIMGFGVSEAKGIKRGVVLNLDEAYTSIFKAIRKAEDSFGGDIEQVYVNLTGQQLKTQTAKTQKFLESGEVVSEEDVQQLTEQAAEIPVPDGFKVYHVSPQLYTVDEENGIQNPVGIAGQKLEASFHVYIAPEQYENNIQKCLDRGGVKLKKAIVDPIATSEVILTEDEKEAGAILLDMGAGTTKFSVYYDNVLCYSSVIPFGGDVVTNDIKEGCAITARQAESLKTQFGEAIGSLAHEHKVVSIPIQGWEPKEISFQSLAFIIQARVEEIIDAFNFQLEKSGYLENIGAGIVITGGTSLLSNLNQLVNFKTGMEVRNGKPNMKDIDGWKELEDPRLGTALGLLTLGINENEGVKKPVRKKKKKVSLEEGFFSSVKNKVAKQVTMFFEEDQDTEMY